MISSISNAFDVAIVLLPIMLAIVACLIAVVTVVRIDDRRAAVAAQAFYEQNDRDDDNDADYYVFQEAALLFGGRARIGDRVGLRVMAVAGGTARVRVDRGAQKISEDIAGVVGIGIA